MAEMKEVAESHQVKERFGKEVIVDGLSIALFRHKDKVYALKNSCPHQGAPIHQGYIRDSHVVCPYHGWSFRVQNGAFVNNDLLKIATYPVEERDGKIFLAADERKFRKK